MLSFFLPVCRFLVVSPAPLRGGSFEQSLQSSLQSRAELSGVWWVWWSQPPCWALPHITCTSPTGLFSSSITSLFFILCLFGTVLGIDCLGDMCKVGCGVFGLLPTGPDFPPFSWIVLAGAFCSLGNALLWRPWRIRVWVSWGISPSTYKSHNELLCSKMHWSSLSTLSNYLANTTGFSFAIFYLKHR